jgi:hypothetical protein
VEAYKDFEIDNVSTQSLDFFSEFNVIDPKSPNEFEVTSGLIGACIYLVVFAIKPKVNEYILISTVVISIALRLYLFSQSNKIKHCKLTITNTNIYLKCRNKRDDWKIEIDKIERFAFYEDNSKLARSKYIDIRLKDKIHKRILLRTSEVGIVERIPELLETIEKLGFKILRLP